MKLSSPLGESTNVEFVHVLESQMQSSLGLLQRKVVPVNFLQVHIWLVRNRNLALLLQWNSDSSNNWNIHQKGNLEQTVTPNIYSKTPFTFKLQSTGKHH